MNRLTTHTLAAGCGVLLVASVLMACEQGAEDGPRIVFEGDHVSFRELPGWQPRHEKGTLVLVGPEAQGVARTTISVHSAPLEGDWVEPRTAELVIPATAKILAALPEAVVSRPRDAQHPHYDGRVFDVTFSPRGKRQRYQRRHAVLLGRERVVHVWLTAPEGRLEPSTALFSQVLASVREEA